MSNEKTIIYVNKDTFDVVVKCDASMGFMPSEQTIAIKKYAELIKQQLQEFLSKKHEPMVKKLLQMIADYNYKHNSDYASKVDETLKKDKASMVVVPEKAKEKVESDASELSEVEKKD